MIIGAKISTALFSYQPETKTFSVDDSTLRGNGAGGVLGRLYDDAYDQGFVLVSEHTGTEVACYLSSIDSDGEDIAGWNFKPVSPRHDFNVLVIND